MGVGGKTGLAMGSGQVARFHVILFWSETLRCLRILHLKLASCKIGTLSIKYRLFLSSLFNVSS